MWRPCWYRSQTGPGAVRCHVTSGPLSPPRDGRPAVQLWASAVDLSGACIMLSRKKPPTPAVPTHNPLPKSREALAGLLRTIENVSRIPGTEPPWRAYAAGGTEENTP